MIWEILLLILVSLYALLRLTSRRYSMRSRFIVLMVLTVLASVLPYGEFWGFRWIMAPIYVYILLSLLFFAFGPKPKGGQEPKTDTVIIRGTQVVSVLYLAFCWVLWAFFPVPDIRPLPGAYEIGYHRLESPLQGQDAYWQVWYPTSDKEWSISDRYLPRPFAGGSWEQLFRHEARNMGKTLAKRGAVGSENWPGVTPGIFFLPSQGHSGEDFTFMLESLASRGFVVVSPLGLTADYRVEGFFWPDLLQDENTDVSQRPGPSADEVRRVLVEVENFWQGLEGQTWHLVAGRDPGFLQNLPRLRGVHIYLDGETRPKRGNTATLLVSGNETSDIPPGTGSLYLEGWGLNDFLDSNLFSPWQKLQGRVSGFGTGEVMDQVVVTWSHFIGHYLSKEFGTLVFKEGQPFRGAYFNWNP